nr:hypothetical protein [Gloeocapsopsis sp. IPPAS B-1203]
MPLSGCVRMRPPSLSGTPWSSMAVKPCSDVGAKEPDSAELERVGGNYVKN